MEKSNQISGQELLLDDARFNFLCICACMCVCTQTFKCEHMSAMVYMQSSEDNFHK